MNLPLPKQAFSLKELNTFGLDSVAESFLEIQEVSQLELLTNTAQNPMPWRVLGGGSNVLLEEFIPGTVMKNSLKGIAVLEESEDSVVLRVGSGEPWHELVMYVVAKGWSGIENLALIPGTVGAAPIQNIGAYGVEVKDTIIEVEVWLWEEHRFITIVHEDCNFGYRDSIFKNELKGKFFISSVSFRLSKHPVLHMDYGAIKDELSTMKCQPNIKNIAQAVMNIRRSKLPDPALLGNAGSFFKNPTIDSGIYLKLKERFPSLPGYPTINNSLTKVSAAWLIEQAGWKGFRRGNVGVHDKQALVLVNFGGGTPKELWQLSQDILLTVQAKFEILLEREVQVW